MGLTFRPAVYKGGELFELPRPITQVRILDRWDFERLKVLMSPGDYLTGHSRHGIEISIEGQFGSHQRSVRDLERNGHGGERLHRSFRHAQLGRWGRRQQDVPRFPCPGCDDRSQ